MAGADPVFLTPDSMREAKVRRRKILTDILLIESQLSHPDRRNQEGVLLSQREYKDWRGRALRKMAILKAEHAFIVDWMKARRLATSANKVLGDEHPDALRILSAVRQFLREHADRLEGTKAGALQDLIGQYIDHEG